MRTALATLDHTRITIAGQALGAAPGHWTVPRPTSGSGGSSAVHLAWLMAHEPSDVGTLAQRVGLSIPTTSQHLAKLRIAKVISARREGRHTYDTVEDPHVLAMIDQIFSHIAADGTLAPDP